MNLLCTNLEINSAHRKQNLSQNLYCWKMSWKKSATCRKETWNKQQQKCHVAAVCSQKTFITLKAEFTVCEFVVKNSQLRKKSWRSLLLSNQVSYPSTAGVCRIALFEQHWWLAAMCCKWGRSPDSRGPAKAKLRRSKEKEEFQSNCLSRGFFTNPVFEQITVLVFFLKPTEKNY